MKTYLESLALLSSLVNEDPKIQSTITCEVGINSKHGACLFYSFYSVGSDFYKVISKEVMRSTYEYYIVNDIHDSYEAYLLPDGSLINIPAATGFGAWVTIPIKKS